MLNIKAKFLNLKVLILDDSSVVLSSTRGMLSRMGFCEKNVFFSHNPKSGISMAKRSKFDIIICDYNFNSTLDGKQVFEEMKHFRCLGVNSLFIIITGDSSLETVNTLIELEPDDYILKPFNQSMLKKRIIKNIHRNNAMIEIYEARDRGDFSQGVKICDQVLPFHPEYKNYITKEKGRFLRLMKLWNESQMFYQNLLSDNNSEWIKIGMSNSMKNTGNIIEARKMVNEVLKNNPGNIEAIKEIASIEILSNNIPSSISHLKIINKLTKGNSDRDLVISNLSLSVGDYSASLEHYKKHAYYNKDTFKNNDWMKINLIRRMLIYCSDVKGRERQNGIDDIEKLMSELLLSENISKKMRIQIDIISSHILILKEKYESSVSLLSASYKRIIKGGCDFHFYDIFYFIWFLSYCSYDKECNSICLMLTATFNKSVIENEHDLNNEIILNSMRLMMNHLLDIERSKKHWLNSQYKLIKTSSKQQLLPIYIDISRKYPTLIDIRIKIIEILGEIWPQGLGKKQVKSLLIQSDEVIRQLSNESELINSSYNIYYNKVISAIERKKIHN